MLIWRSNMEKAEIQSLIRDAFEAQKFAYVPYSRFHVGAALLGKTAWSTKAAISKMPVTPPPTVLSAPPCSRRSARGEREFTAIAIVGSKVGEKNTLVTGPCGVCRQALFEFGGPSLTVIMAKSEDDYIVTTLGELLPYGFGPANLD